MKINFIYDLNVSLEQMIGYEIAALLWGQLFTDEMEVNIFAQGTDSLDSNVIGGAIPEFHEQHYALFLEYYEADITSEEDQVAFDALQEGNTIDFLLNGDLVEGNTKLKLTTALAKALGMTEAISLERYLLDESEHFLDGTIMMNQNFAWDFNYLRDSEAAENSLDFLSVALHETGHILGFTSSLDFSLQQDTLYSGRTELSNFSPLDLFRFSAESLGQNNPDGVVNDLSIGGVAWFSTDGGETLSAKMSTGKEGDGFQASHWERRYNPLGIMDPTLWYQERAEITDLDVLAFDIMGYDLSSTPGDVEDFFEAEGLERLLAQAKVQLAHKLGMTVEEIETNTNVPLSSLELIAQMETAYLEAAAAEGSTTESSSDTSASNNDNNDSDSGSGLDSLSNRELKDFFKDLNKMMGDIYRWWRQSGGDNDDSSWQELYQWWAQSGGDNGNSSWQELFEWWVQNGGNNGNSSWQELYEWWAQNGGNNSGSSWQELYEWWAQSGGDNGNSSWQELSAEELAKFHQEVAGKKESWWQEVFFASQDGGNLDNVKLPGWAKNSESEVVAQEINGGDDDDIFGGDIGNDNIVAGKGDDLIDGAAGDDTIFGAGGYDTIFGFDGNDSIMGGVGDDVISGESDEDALYGEAGADVLMGGDHDDYLDGGAGRDFLNGNRGNDALIGGTGDDALEGESGKDLLVGGEGQDIGNGGSGDDFIFGDQYSASVKQAFGNSNNLSPLTSLFTPATPETATDSGSTSDSTEELITVVLAQDPILIEAEDMTLSGDFRLDDKFALASGGIVVKNDSETTLAIEFNGTAGLYNIVVNYHDVKGTGEIIANLDGVAVDNWLLDKNLGGKKPAYNNLTTHTIGNVALNEGDVFSLDTIRSGDDKGYIDSVQFISVENTNNHNTNNIVLDPFRIEAENLNWSGDEKVDDKNFASGGGYVFNDSKNSTINGSTTFTGESGLYNVILGYYDSAKGEAQVTVNLDGAELDSWSLNLDLNDNPDSKNFVTRTLAYGVNIEQGDVLEIEGIRYDNDDKVYLDFLEFVPFNPNATVKIEAEYFNLTGDYDLQEEDFAASGRLIKTDSSATLSTDFRGQTGLYNVIVGYHDVKGTGQLSASLEGTEIDSWSLTKDLGGDNPEMDNFTFRMISDVSINTGDTFSLSTIRDDKDKGYIDYVEFVPIVEDTPIDEVVLAQDPIVIEAENMTLSGGYFPDNDYYDGTVIRTSSNHPHGLASQTFTGDTGYYQIKVRYIDESDGNASLSVKIAGTEIDNWVLDQNTSGDNQYYSRTLTEGMYIDANAMIEIQGQAESSEFARVDYIEFIPVEPPTTSDSNDPETSPEPINLPPGLELGDYSDILRGGQGNDGIDGGAGNDIIFGEDESNDSSYIYAPFIDGAFTYGHSSYLLTTPGLTWAEAQAEAESYGGNLVTINDAAENQWLLDTFGVDNDWLWTGFTDQDQEGTFKWASGEAVTYTNWAPGQPYDDGGNQHYAILNWNNQGWDDNQGTWQWQGIIEIDWSSVGGNDTIFGGAGDDQVYGNTGNDVIYGDELPGVTGVGTPSTLTFQQGLNGYNSTVDTTLEADFVNTNNSGDISLNVDTNSEGNPAHSLLRFENIFGSQADQIGLSDTINSAFLELNISNTGGNIEFYEMLQGWSDSDTWNSIGNGIQTNGTEAANTSVVIADGSSTGVVTIDVTASLQAWQANPNSNQGWALLPTNDDGVDFDSAEGNIAPRLVVNVNQGSSAVPNTNNIVDVASLPDGIIHNGSLYIVNNTKVNWEDAQTYAESLGGNLVTINDGAEQSWLETTFNLGTGSRYWIGLNDKAVEGQFTWVSGEEVTYTNWDGSNPNNSGATGGPANYVSTQMDNPRWNDGDITQEYRSIIEINLTNNTNNGNVYNGSQYLLTDTAMTWLEAQAYAESIGGNLVTINDAAEEQWIQQTFGFEGLWIGLSDAETEGTFKWASGEVGDWVLGAANNGIYSNWTPGQPDDYQDGQDYALMNYTASGTTTNLWDDASAYATYKGLIEIKLSNTTSGGNDNLFGNGGHDTINGGAGNDVVNGTDEVVAGYLERDVLVGGAGADKFILGDDTQAYYATGGSQDYAVIKDFDSGIDIIQLHGVAGDYQQQQQGDDIHLTRNGDLVAILENNSTLNLNGSGFTYISTV